MNRSNCHTNQYWLWFALVAGAMVRHAHSVPAKDGEEKSAGANDGKTGEAIVSYDRLSDVRSALGRGHSPAKKNGGQKKPKPASAPSRGYSGTQIFSTIGCGKEQAEPDH